MTRSEESRFVEIREVAKVFGTLRAVDSVSLDIEGGEFFSLLGPSGCGKTTLLRMLGGFEIPESGSIRIDGADITDAPPHKRPTNMVFQSYAIFPHLNVRDNIAYGLRRRRVARRDLARRVDRYLELINLPGYGDRKATELSGGQKQRVALARALILEPKVLLLDEPLGALDKKLRERMQLELRALQREVGITFIFVTHDQEEALTMSDRIAVMAAGRLLQVAAPRRLYEQPSSLAVAEFIGTINVVEGRVRELEEGGALVDTDRLGRLWLPGRKSLVPGQAVVLAIRPEHLAIAPADGATETDGPRCSIRGMAYFGDRCHYHVQGDGWKAPLVIAMGNSVPAELAPGADVRLSWDTSRVMLLPGTT